MRYEKKARWSCAMLVRHLWSNIFLCWLPIEAEIDSIEIISSYFVTKT